MHAIVVAFGPKAATREAVRRLRRIALVDTVHLVAANERSSPIVSQISGVQAAEGLGSDEVRRLAALSSSAPVLVVHDDVYVSPKALMGMLAVLDQGADIVAPHSNEVGTEQFVGALPPVQEAASTVDRLGDLGLPRRISGARHSCVLAAGDTIASLGGTLVIPGASVIRSHAQIMLAPIAVAHDLSCHERLVPAVGDAPLMVASMIVRDEEDQIAQAIESVSALVDRVEICDTGSEDATIEVARRAGAVVREIEWRNDFGWARNQALESCRDADFFLHLDADERVTIDNPELFRRWLKTWRSELRGVSVTLRNHRSSGDSNSTHRATRVARTRGATWVGALHESIRFPDGGDGSIAFYDGLVIDHYGYSHDIVEAKGKADRNIEISRAAYEAEPSVKTAIDYARSLRMRDERSEEADRLFRESLAEVDGTTISVIASYLLGVVAASDLDRGDVGSAVERARAAVDLVPKEDIALLTLGFAYTRQERWEDIVELCAEFETRPSAAPLFSMESNVHRFEVLVARALAELGRIDEAWWRIERLADVAPSIVSDAVGECIEPLLEHGLDGDRLVRLATLDDAGSVIGRVVKLVSAPVTAHVALSALSSGARSASLFTTGLAAALIRSEAGVAEAFLDHLDLAAAHHLDGLADMARRRGREDVAARLVQPKQPGWGDDLTNVARFVS